MYPRPRLGQRLFPSQHCAVNAQFARKRLKYLSPAVNAFNSDDRVKHHEEVYRCCGSARTFCRDSACTGASSRPFGNTTGSCAAASDTEGRSADRRACKEGRAEKSRCAAERADAREHRLLGRARCQEHPWQAAQSGLGKVQGRRCQEEGCRRCCARCDTGCASGTRQEVGSFGGLFDLKSLARMSGAFCCLNGGKESSARDRAASQSECQAFRWRCRNRDMGRCYPCRRRCIERPYRSALPAAALP